MGTTTGSGQNTNQFQTFVYQWVDIPNGNAGNWVDVTAYGDVEVQVTGTFGASGNVNIEGNLDGSTNVTLTDQFGNSLALTAAGLHTVAQLPKQIRPNVTDGDGTTSLTVTIVCRPVS